MKSRHGTARWVALAIAFGALSLGAFAAKRQVERDKVLVMAGPGSFYAKKGELVRGASVEVVSEKGGWLEVKAGAISGFVRGRLLTCSVMCVIYSVGWTIMGVTDLTLLFVEVSSGEHIRSPSTTAERVL